MITINVLTVHGAASSLILNNITYYLYNTIWIIHLEFHLFIKYWLGSFQDFCFVYHLTIQFDLTEWAEVIYKNPQSRQWQNDLRSSKKFSFKTTTEMGWGHLKNNHKMGRGHWQNIHIQDSHRMCWGHLQKIHIQDSHKMWIQKDIKGCIWCWSPDHFQITYKNKFKYYNTCNPKIVKQSKNLNDIYNIHSMNYNTPI